MLPLDVSHAAQARGRSFFKDNGLTVALLLVFIVTLAGQLLTGWSAENEDLLRHEAPPIGLASYAVSGSFISALFENWESEFLQMAAYVILTAVLYQRGSAESRDPDDTPGEKAERERWRPDSPWATRATSIIRWLYAKSLGIALLILFAISFALHWLGSWRAACDQAVLHKQALPTALDHLTDAGFWFESFQNWQSEFLSTAVLVVLSIYLRQKGSPESKAVHAAHRETGA